MTRFVRRLQRIGSSMLVSLPKDWVVANGLGKSSQVEIETSQGGLSITVTGRGRQTRDLVIAYPLPRDENITANLTGAYLLGYDVIRITSTTTLPVEDRERIRDSTRRLVGMEIVEEDPASVTMQFLLDPTTLNPERILARMNTISLGMFGEVLKSMKTGELSGLDTLRNRDEEVNRQYFLLVRLIRSTLVDGRMSGAFGLETTDVLDYRIAAHLLENAGDTIVWLGGVIRGSALPQDLLGGVHEVAGGLERLAARAIAAMVNHDRQLAIEAISLHREYQEGLQRLRTGMAGDVPITYIELVYGLERIGRFWSDVADLVRPVYD